MKLLDSSCNKNQSWRREEIKEIGLGIGQIVRSLTPHLWDSLLYSLPAFFGGGMNLHYSSKKIFPLYLRQMWCKFWAKTTILILSLYLDAYREVKNNLTLLRIFSLTPCCVVSSRSLSISGFSSGFCNPFSLLAQYISMHCKIKSRCVAFYNSNNSSFTSKKIRGVCEFMKISSNREASLSIG